MSKKIYSKPDFTMMRFALNDNVANTACDYYDKVNVPCLLTGSHNVFYDACGDDNYNNMTTVTLTEDVYLNGAGEAINYLYDLSDGALDGRYQSGSYKLSAGTTYLVWSDGKLTHAGKVTESVQHGINASV